MKKSIFKIGTVLSKTEQKSIHGGNGSNLCIGPTIAPGGNPCGTCEGSQCFPS